MTATAPVVRRIDSISVMDDLWAPIGARSNCLLSSTGAVVIQRLPTAVAGADDAFAAEDDGFDPRVVVPTL